MSLFRWEFWRSLVICQVWAFVLFLPTLAELTRAHNRYFFFWTTTSLLLHLAAVTTAGLLLFVLGLLLWLIRPRNYRALAGVAAIATLAFLLQALLLEWFSSWYTVLNMTPLGIGTSILITAILCLRGVSIEWVRQKLAQAALLFSFLPLLFWFTCFGHATYPERDYPPLATVADRAGDGYRFPAANVYIFVLDAWSYRLTLREDGSVWNDLPALRALAEEACVFTNGHSPGCHTAQSVPRILFQRQDLFVLHHGQPGFWTEDRYLPCSELPHLFTYACDRGFRTYMVGWHHPYFALLEERCDHVHAIPSVQWVGPSLPERAGAICWRWAKKYLGPIPSIPLRCNHDFQANHAFLWQNEDLLHHARAVLSDDRPAGQFAVIHLPVPHVPFIFTKEGVGDLDRVYSLSCPKQARGQHAYLDGLIGGFLAELRQRGKYDNSIIVLTGDHTWREDLDILQTAHDYTHVPLFIRFPGQDQPVKVEEPFTTSSLLSLFEQVQRSEGRWKDLDRILARQQWYHPVSDEELPLWIVPSR